MNRRHRTDFPRLIVSLESMGMRRIDVARELGVAPSTVTRIARGDRRPGFDLGADIAYLHARQIAQWQRRTP